MRFPLGHNAGRFTLIERVLFVSPLTLHIHWLRYNFALSSIIASTAWYHFSKPMLLLLEYGKILLLDCSSLLAFYNKVLIILAANHL